ncbi:hypothetical protein ElyMa_003061700 [Elysia marginata]|uniref:Reverse transcriptase domain-containing protein n=1 Tax=Elysia marginata TaxID=1093978 RepID=A0AAV4IEL0_9GAST|nr:hypothetical protein ElyMa_003061700 [Elysia marginata]
MSDVAWAHRWITAEVLNMIDLWAHRWITAEVLNMINAEVNITGIDVSAAFDTINQTKLLEILKDAINKHGLCTIQYLLSRTTIKVKINGTDDPIPFTTNHREID